MAGTDHTPEHEHGTMSTTAQEKTFAGFVTRVTWGVAISVGILVFLALANS